MTSQIAHKANQLILYQISSVNNNNNKTNDEYTLHSHETRQPIFQFDFQFKIWVHVANDVALFNFDFLIIYT